MRVHDVVYLVIVVFARCEHIVMVQFDGGS